MWGLEVKGEAWAEEQPWWLSMALDGTMRGVSGTLRCASLEIRKGNWDREGDTGEEQPEREVACQGRVVSKPNSQPPRPPPRALPVLGVPTSTLRVTDSLEGPPELRKAGTLKAMGQGLGETRWQLPVVLPQCCRRDS